MRMRCFELSRGACDGASKGSTAVDWVGFDGPVKSVKWSATGRWLAALGGRSLLVAPQSARYATLEGTSQWWPRVPTICVADDDSCSGDSAARLSTFEWVNEGVCAVSLCIQTRLYHHGTHNCFRDRPMWPQAHERLLAAMQERTCMVLLFDVERIDSSVPRRAHPIIFVTPPMGPVQSSSTSSLAPLRVAFSARGPNKEADADSIAQDHSEMPLLVASSGDWVVGIGCRPCY